MNISYKNYLLPHGFKFAGMAMIPVGILFAISRFYYGIKPAWLTVKPFTFYSSYLENKYFSFTRNNFGEEVPALLIFTGIMFLVLSKEKIEHDSISIVRFNSFLLSLYFNFFLFVTVTLFFFGLAYIEAAIISLFCFPLAYYLIFKVSLYINRKKLSEIF